MSLGDKLREARINKGYTLNTMQQMTKIQKKYLQAIEEERFDEMPGNFYVRAFIKQYADVVGLNGDDLLEEYEQTLNLDSETEDAVAASGGDELPKRSDLTGSNEKNSMDVLLSYMPMILLVAIIIMIIISLIYAINRINTEDTEPETDASSMTSIVSLVDPDSDSNENTAEEPENESASESAPQELQEGQQRVGNQVITQISAPGEAPVFQLEGTIEDYTFEIEGLNFVWAGVLEDNVMMIDQTVSEGESVEYTANSTAQQIILNRGYPEGAIFKVNGTEIELPEGQFIESITFVTYTNAPASETQIEESETSTPLSEESSEEATQPAEDAEADGYQGPAVYDPNNP
ncbi:helix-turn-helix domain-containing protein [Aerococcaceae bacterium DSM 111020]|nr:helix-turn-helix domain-containing protein [Aerococcaceae bacterium DSM 111020]